jgi:hypothetical protein
MLSKSSRNVSEKKTDTLKVLIATVPFKIVPLGAYTAIPTFLPRPEAVLDLLYVVKSSPFQLDFHLGEEEEVTGG